MSKYMAEVLAKAKRSAAVAAALEVLKGRSKITGYAFSPLKKYFYSGPTRIATFSSMPDARAFSLAFAVTGDLWAIYEIAKNSAQGCPMAYSAMRHQVYCPNCELARRIEKFEAAVESHITMKTMKYQK